MKKFYEKFCKAEVAVASTCLITCVSVIFISALLRVIGHPINWATDLSLLLFTWSTFMGADIAFRAGKLVNVDILANMLPDCMRKWNKIVIYSVCLIFLFALVYLGFIQSVKTWHRSFNGISWLSYTWVTLSVPVCCLSMIVTTLLKIRDTVKNVAELTFL